MLPVYPHSGGIILLVRCQNNQMGLTSQKITMQFKLLLFCLLSCVSLNLDPKLQNMDQVGNHKC